MYTLFINGNVIVFLIFITLFVSLSYISKSFLKIYPSNIKSYISLSDITYVVLKSYYIFYYVFSSANSGTCVCGLYIVVPLLFKYIKPVSKSTYQ